MRRGVGIGGVMMLVVAACASESPPDASVAESSVSVETTDAPTTTTPLTVTTTAPTTTPTTTPTTMSTTVLPTTIAGTSTTTLVPPVDEADDAPLDEAEAPGGGETVDPLSEADDVVYDEPTFDIGPQVDIDVDLARFPIDDAGLGGGAVLEPGEPGDPGDPETPAAAATGWAAVDRYLESALIVPGNTAAALAVSIGGEVVHTAAFGERDPASGDSAEPRDRFRIASISKPITAIVAMTLVEAGAVGLDDPIGQVLADHVGLSSVSSGAQQLTLRRLLSHRSGFGKYESTFFRSGADSCEDAARQGLSRGVGGGGYTYSNMNYCLVGLLIEALTGLTYEQAAYQQLLTPLGISGMRLPPTVDPGPDEIQHQTTDGRNYMETLGAAGSWIATPSDLVTILDSLDLSTPGFKPLSQEAVFQMAIPVGGQYGQRGYGLGLISYGDGRFGHTGTIESTHAMLLNRGDGVTWALTVAGQTPSESTALERIMNRAFEAGGFVTT